MGKVDLARPVVHIAQANGLTRVRGTIIEVLDPVDGAAAWARTERGALIVDVGSFRIADSSGTLTVGAAAPAVDLFAFDRLATKPTASWHVGDMVELHAHIASSGKQSGPYRGTGMIVRSSILEPALLLASSTT